MVPAARARRGSADHQRHDQEPAGIARAGTVLEPQRRRLGHRGAAGRRPARDHACAAARRGTALASRPRTGCGFCSAIPPIASADTVATRVPGAAGDPGRTAFHAAHAATGPATSRSSELHAATARVGVALASRFPYLNIRGDVVLRSSKPRSRCTAALDNPAQELFSVGPFASVPIWQSGAGTRQRRCGARPGPAGRARLPPGGAAGAARGVGRAHRHRQGARGDRAGRDPRLGDPARCCGCSACGIAAAS